jgi:predicted thioesterase
MIGDAETAVGKTADASMTVSESDTACAVGSGSLDVFATPMMIALMERAACIVLSDVLEEGQTSVGTQIDVSHTAASRVGAEITATATITGVDGRKVDFVVTASDGAGEIGSGRHTRVIVDGAKFMAKVRGKQ